MSVSFANGTEEPLPSGTNELIRLGGSGNRLAIEALIGRYQERVAGFVFSQTRDDGHVEDLCQVIFVKMVLALPRLRDVDRFEPWLFQIARNACRDHLRARRGWLKIFVPFDRDSEAVAAPAAPPDDDVDEKFARGLEQLPAAQKNLLQLSLDHKTSYDELAQLSNSSVSSVKARLHRARVNLRAILLAGETK